MHDEPGSRGLAETNYAGIGVLAGEMGRTPSLCDGHGDAERMMHESKGRSPYFLRCRPREKHGNPHR